MNAPQTRPHGARRLERRLTVAVVTLVAAATASTPLAQEPRGLTGVRQLERAYDAILDARFDEASSLTNAACGPAPREACQLMDAMAIWWRIQLDPHDMSRDAAFEHSVDASIAATEAWSTREPGRAEAWFYLGGAYAARAQWRALRGNRLSAARDGKRIKDALERALALDSSVADAYFGIGLYRYYADVAPTALKMLRWLLLLPGGDREAGLNEIARARRDAQLMRSEADYQLHLLYLWYEKQPARALELLDDLQRRHPHNPHFMQARAEVQDIYLQDAGASLKSWEELLDAAREGRVREARLAETTAHLGMALTLDRAGRLDAAIEHLSVVTAGRPAVPFAATARAYLHLGELLARTGRRAQADAAFRSAIATAGADDPLKIAARARAALRALGA